MKSLSEWVFIVLTNPINGPNERKANLSKFLIILGQIDLEKVILSQIWDLKTVY